MTMIERLKDFPDNVLAFACHGRVTKDDYETVLIPAVEEALKNHGKLRLFYEIAADFAGIEPAAVWKDFRVGMEHITRWERMAVVTDVDWIKHMIRFFSFLLPGEMKIFPLSEAETARVWVVSSN